jgi:hypothetical protein
MSENEDVKRLQAASEDVMARIAVQVSGALLRFDDHVAQTMKRHLDSVVMMGLGFEPDHWETYRIKSGVGHTVVEMVERVAAGLVKEQARDIFAKIIKGKSRAKLVDVVRNHFRSAYRKALLDEIKRLVAEEIQGVEKEIEREISTEVPKNFKIVMEPVIEAVRNSTLERLASGQYTTEYGREVEETIEGQLNLTSMR